jgi:hypothetical protein
MNGATKHDLKVRRRPGAIQTTVVVSACLALLVFAAYAGYQLLAGRSIGVDLHWLEETIGSYLG